jgi:hypothetical protein
VTNQFSLKFEQLEGVYQLRLVNLNGQIIWEKNYLARTQQLISTQNLLPGIYMLQVIQNNKIVGAKKIIK